MNTVNELCANLDGRRDAVEEWLVAEFAKQRVPFCCSVDLRVSDHKIASVDANLFPGGFNNLARADRDRAAAATVRLLASQWPTVHRIAVITERHTRNPYYATHLGVLRDILVAAGVEVRLVFLDGEAVTLSGHHNEVAVGVLRRDGDRVMAGDWVPDLVLLNHDQSGGVPAILEGISVEVVPPLEAGWSRRRKSAHFFQYERVVGRFARAFGLEAWLLQAYFNVCNRVDVSKRVGLDCLVRAIEETLSDITDNYARIGSDTKAFVALKADAGTYGMGVVMLEAAAAARQLNRRQRQNLSVGKDGVAVRDILIQEGVPTKLRVEGFVAEPVYYMIGTEVVGGFWRLNETHGERDNLNSRGMFFWPMVGGNQPQGAAAYTQRVVARLAVLATARELSGELSRPA